MIPDIICFILYFSSWFICGIIASGFYLAFFLREFSILGKDYNQIDRKNSRVLIVFGPLYLIAILLMGLTNHGWRLK